jgi:hypothetical protein
MAKRNDTGMRNLSLPQVRKLLKLPWVVDEALSSFGVAHVLEDGRVVVYTPANTYGHLYPSREVLEEVNRSVAETEREAAELRAAGCPSSCLKFLPPIDDFLRDVGAHADSLGKTIKVAADALDRSVASLDAVNKALKRIPWDKRPVPEILTPLTAYVGEVMRVFTGGRWEKYTTRELTNFCDPDELIASWAAKRKIQPLAAAAGDKAAAEAKARGASADDVQSAWFAAYLEVYDQVPQLTSARTGIREDNEPRIRAGNGVQLDPFNLLLAPMIEPSERMPLRFAVELRLRNAGYPPAPKPSA